MNMCIEIDSTKRSVDYVSSFSKTARGEDPHRGKKPFSSTPRSNITSLRVTNSCRPFSRLYNQYFKE